MFFDFHKEVEQKIEIQEKNEREQLYSTLQNLHVHVHYLRKVVNYCV